MLAFGTERIDLSAPQRVQTARPRTDQQQPFHDALRRWIDLWNVLVAGHVLMQLKIVFRNAWYLVHPGFVKHNPKRDAPCVTVATIDRTLRRVV